MPIKLEYSDDIEELMKILTDAGLCPWTDIGGEDWSVCDENQCFDEIFESGVDFCEKHGHPEDDVVVQCYYVISHDHSWNSVLYYVGSEKEIIARIKKNVIELIEAGKITIPAAIKRIVADWDLQTILKEIK